MNNHLKQDQPLQNDLQNALDYGYPMPTKEEELKFNLERFIASAINQDGSVSCYEDGQPITYVAELLLGLLESEGYSSEIMDQAEREIECFICQEKHSNPNCECCMSTYNLD